MKIECDKCSAKYSIADEKVRGKTFKIRCKKCSNVIIVRDKAVAAAAAGGGGGGVDVGIGDAAEAAGWHLAINGETVGPMGEDEVRQRYDAGEIDKDTAIWQEGFEDWVPLGEVDVFAAFPDRPAAAEDPFVSANQDDYAATGTGGGTGGGLAGGVASAATALAGGDRGHQPASPRVSSLTGQRNENSVLFSLDSLQAIATGGGAARQAAAPIAARTTANPSKGLATSAPSSEGSGLIDIRALGAMVGSDSAAPAAAAAPNRAADDNALPSFGGAGFGGLTATPLVPQAAAVEAAAAAALAAAVPQQRSNAPLYVMMIVLILAVLGLAAFILMREPEPREIVKEVPAQAPSVTDSDKDDEDKDEDKDEDEDKDDEGEKAAEGESGGADADAEADADADEKSGKSSTKPRSKSTKPRSKSTKPSSSSSSTPSSSTPPSTKKDDDDIPIECVLDPKSCKGGKPAKSSTTTPTPKADPSLPKSLTQSDIRSGVNAHKSAAKACGSKHGAPDGTKVTVKLSIAGATGTVSSASAMGKHAGTALGNCVAAALKRATFKKFQKSSIGVQYPITM